MRNHETGEVQYVRRTCNPGRRQRQHKNDPRKQHLDPLEVKFTGLTVPEARAMGQLLISAYTIQNSDNARREIAAGKVSGFAGKIENIINISGGAAEDEFLNLMER